ncbi:MULTISPECIES: K+/H+ antiporter subunit F [Rhizobium/Agrobacterium group]|jgi:multicomponent K+:H+ antiporter subunit F|uniref:K+/H+ antiporter subunit F n=2 Tax=Rhizobium/Agrobacterium group TaxID=227290 RepID=A0AA92C2Z5_RHIRH|nr:MULTISPECIES: K+/H+ antiporter subunit F [Rhizobium/Agrobacterium group]KQM34510.1 cation:proton antiporter [Rhizobium sp. Leaf202]KQN80383.1 cation:proton antiporter [Rhizobium sp. Leaf68]KRA00518.1 cation:proton antiporter [Rhizobium sp. Root564]MQB22200.1 K+/H+ antiporter subunit F [Agrobacterium tumefaciens]PVE76545.1 K+/H+ antiporter subunit F [Sphingomonas sp. TPD3009]
MSSIILFWSFSLAQIFLAIAMSISVYRIAIGPRAQDRVLGVDTLYVSSMLLLMTFGLRTGNDIYFEAALLMSILGFVSTVALSKFLMRGEVIE